MVASLLGLAERELIDDPKPTAVRLASRDFSRHFSIAESRRGECKISTAQRWGLKTRIELRAIGQKPGEEFSDLDSPDRDFSVAVSHQGMGLIQRHKTIQIACVGAFYEKPLQVVWFLR